MKKRPFALTVLLCTLITPLSARLIKPSIGGWSFRRFPDLFCSVILVWGHWKACLKLICRFLHIVKATLILMSNMKRLLVDSNDDLQ